MIQLLALDIDGTLMEPGASAKDRPGFEMTNLVQALSDAGVVVVLATGRMYPGTRYISEHLEIEQPLICQQGASVHNSDGTLRFTSSIPQDIARELYDYASAHSWPLAWFDSSRYLVTESTPEAQYFANLSHVDIEVDPKPHLSDVLPTCIDIISDHQNARDIHILLKARYGERISLLDFPSVTAAHAPHASKGNALRMIANELGIDQQNVLAIGDSVNDVSMLSWAGQSAAPAHCDQYAREAAKEILTGDGVAGVIKRLAQILD